MPLFAPEIGNRGSHELNGAETIWPSPPYHKSTHDSFGCARTALPMCAFVQISRGWLGVLAAVLTTVVLAAADETEAGLSGLYADEGTTVASDSGLFVGNASLHALLKLEFDPKVVNVLDDETAQIAVKHEGTLLEIQAFDHEGTVSWKAQWREGDGYVQRGRVVVLRFRTEKFGSDEFIVQLESVTVHRLLQVKVQRVAPTLLGPVVRATGTYLFHRMP